MPTGITGRQGLWSVAVGSRQAWLTRIPWLVTGLYAIVAFAGHPSWGLTVFGDAMQFVLLLALCAGFSSHIPQEVGRARW
ncbi:MAG TPA: hypothetical protein VFM10_11500, partial [Terriglobales bacterium]|nr:hypothetical protein [Terriglobales bacterium]